MKNNFNKAKIIITDFYLKILLFCAFVYLLLPQVLYFLVSFKIVFSFFYFIAIFILLYSAWKSIPKFELTVTIPISVIVIAEMCIIFVLLFSGVGGICGQQSGDYTRSNAILSDLILYNWPVYYNSNSIVKTLNYYIAYFIPGSLIGKAFSSFIIGDIAILIWSIIGLNIGILLILIVSNVIKSKTIILFFCWSGLDCIGYILTNHSLFWGTSHLEHWANLSGQPNGHIANYQSIATGLLWSIQHYIPAIIAAPIFVLLARNKKYILSTFIASCLLFWSPLIVVGLVPYFIFFLIKEKFKFKFFFSFTDIFALCIIALPCIFYFFSMNLSEVGGRTQVFRGIRWLLENWPIFLLFIFLEFGFISFLLLKTGQLLKIDKEIIFISMFSMFFPLFIDYGLCHDFSMRATIIPWIIIFLYFPKAYETSRKGCSRTLFVLYIIGSVLSSSTEYARMFLGVINHPFPAGRSFWAGNTIKECPLEAQYTGSADALFFNKFCKKEVSTAITFYHTTNFTDVNWTHGVNNATKKCILFNFNNSLLSKLSNSSKLEVINFDYKTEEFVISRYEYDSEWIKIFVEKDATICQFPSNIFFK